MDRAATNLAPRLISHHLNFHIPLFVTGCDNVPNSGLVVDGCGVCGGDNSTCSDCRGLLNPPIFFILDACGDCRNGTGDPLFNSQCNADCSGVFAGTASVDLCGICRNASDPLRDSTCKGCDGVPNSGFTRDGCYVCLAANDPQRNASCSDCAGTVNGTLVIDNCGVCGGNSLSCISGLCYVDSIHPNVDVPGSLIYSDFQTALNLCALHPGVLVVDATVTGTFSSATTVPGYRIESVGPQTTIVGEQHTFMGTELSVRGFRWQRGTVGTLEIATVRSCGCVTFTNNVIDASLLQGTGVGIRVLVDCLPEPSAPPTGCTSQLGDNAVLGPGSQPSTVGLYATLNSAVNITGFTCTNNAGRCVHVDRVDHQLRLAQFTMTNCGSTASPCIDVMGSAVGTGRQPILQAAIAGMVHTAPGSGGGGVNDAAIHVSQVDFGTVAQPTVTGSTASLMQTGLSLRDIPQIDTADALPGDYALDEYLRILWLNNRLPTPFAGTTHDVRYRSTASTDRTCNDGCSYGATVEFFADPGYTTPFVFGVDQYPILTVVYVRFTLAGLTASEQSRFRLTPLYVLVCDPATLVPPYSAATPTATGCAATGTTKLLFDHTGPVPNQAFINPVFTPGSNIHQQLFSFNGDGVLTPVLAKTLQIVYDVVDTVDARVHSLATSPLDFNILNPSHSSTARFSLGCPSGETPILAPPSPAQCVDSGAVGGGGGGGGTSGGIDAGTIIAIGAGVVLLIAGVVVCAGIGSGTSTRRRKKDDTKKKKKKKKKDKESDDEKEREPLVDRDDDQERFFEEYGFTGSQIEMNDFGAGGWT